MAAFLFPVPSRAQSHDVAEAARQERERKAKEQAQAKPHHVYTEEDLKRPHILTSEDQLRAEARSKAAPGANPLPADASLDAASAPGSSAASADAGSTPESLGEIARRYRAEKLASAAQIHPHVPANSVRTQHVPMPRFPLGIRPPALADPVQPIVVTPSAAGPSKPVIVLAPNFLESGARPAAPVHRRDPFAPPAILRVMPRAEIALQATQPVRPSVLEGKSVGPKAPANRALTTTPIGPVMNDVRPAIKSFTPESLPKTPKPGVNPRLRPMPAPGKALARGRSIHVTVLAGDSLWKIARRYLGHGARWQEITRADGRALNPLRLLPGTEVAIPQ
jgi:nucleoid-associated protein YgaU